MVDLSWRKYAPYTQDTPTVKRQRNPMKDWKIYIKHAYPRTCGLKLGVNDSFSPYKIYRIYWVSYVHSLLKHDFFFFF